MVERNVFNDMLDMDKKKAKAEKTKPIAELAAMCGAK